MNKALFWREMRGSLGLLVIFGGVLTLYIVMIAGLYDKETQQALQQFYDMMPQLMAAVGMNGEGDTLLSFLSTYLYGMLLLAFPMVYAILRARGLVARYVEKGSMYALCAAPVSRLSLAGTQLAVLVSTQFGLLLYCTVLEIVSCQVLFPGDLDIKGLLCLNGGLLCLHLCLGAFCFLVSCLGEGSRCTALMAGVPTMMLVMQMLANLGGKLEKFQYVTLFSLFQPEKLMAGEGLLPAGMLLLLAVLFSALALWGFCRRDLYI